MDPVWSILIPTCPSRLRNGAFARCVEQLHQQAWGKPVEVLGFYDNKQRTVAAKRNGLLQLARGTFFSFVDDDDIVPSIYVETILDTIQQNPTADVIVYDHVVTIDGGEPKLCKYGVEYEYLDTPALWTGKPAHTQTWRTALVRDIPFPEEFNVGEDVAWVLQASERVRNQVRIPKVLYHYNCSWQTSQTRAAGLVEDVPPERQEDWRKRCR